MFLSQVQLNPARRDARRILTSPHVLHAAVLAAFPDPSPRATGRVLWRLDAPRPSQHPSHDRRTLLYVVSPEAPDFTHLAEQAGWPSRPDTQKVTPYDTTLNRVEGGQRYGFRLTANPVRSERVPAGGRGKVHGHVTTTQQEQWLLDREERAGFRIDSFEANAPQTDVDPLDKTASDASRVQASGAVSPERAMRITDRRTLTFSRRETSVTLRVATFEGILTVTEPEAFVRTLSFGLGRAKGYGCGLMTIAPVR